MNQNPTGIIYSAPPTDMSELTAKTGIVLSKVKPGSYKVACDCCGIPVWIGPNMRESLKTMPGDVFCFLCTLATKPDPTLIIPLGKEGNEYQKPGNN